jgi:hypothetical protein
MQNIIGKLCSLSRIRKQYSGKLALQKKNNCSTKMSGKRSRER